MQQSAFEHAALIWTRPANTIRARGMKMAASKAGHMSAPDDAPKAAPKLPLAQGAVTHAAWLGLVPRQHSTGGKQRLGATTKMGERSLRRLLIIGANSVIIKRHVHASARPGTWLGGMLTRKPPMLVRVSLANKMARIVWALMARGGVYQSPAAAA